jgi:hypothetical protein
MKQGEGFKGREGGSEIMPTWGRREGAMKGLLVCIYYYRDTCEKNCVTSPVSVILSMMFTTG